MVIVRGVNVFPGAVAKVLNGFAVLSGEFRILLDGSPPFDRLPLEAELAPGREETPELAAEIATAVREATRASADVRLLAAGTLPLSDGKTRRVVRKS